MSSSKEVSIKVGTAITTFRSWSPVSVVQLATGVIFATALSVGLLAGATVSSYADQWKTCESTLENEKNNSNIFLLNHNKLRTVDLVLCEGNTVVANEYEPVDMTYYTTDDLTSITERIFPGSLVPLNMSYLPWSLPLYYFVSAPVISRYAWHHMRRRQIDEFAVTRGQTCFQAVNNMFNHNGLGRLAGALQDLDVTPNMSLVEISPSCKSVSLDVNSYTGLTHTSAAASLPACDLSVEYILNNHYEISSEAIGIMSYDSAAGSKTEIIKAIVATYYCMALFEGVTRWAKATGVQTVSFTAPASSIANAANPSTIFTTVSPQTLVLGTSTIDNCSPTGLTLGDLSHNATKYGPVIYGNGWPLYGAYAPGDIVPDTLYSGSPTTYMSATDMPAFSA